MSLKARTSSSSYSISAGVWRATMRQNAQSALTDPPGSVYTSSLLSPASAAIPSPTPSPVPGQGDTDGYLSQVQAANPPERQSRQARLGLDAQDVSGQARPRHQGRLIPARPHSPSQRRPCGGP